MVAPLAPLGNSMLPTPPTRVITMNWRTAIIALLASTKTSLGRVIAKFVGLGHTMTSLGRTVAPIAPLGDSMLPTPPTRMITMNWRTVISAIT